MDEDIQRLHQKLKQSQLLIEAAQSFNSSLQFDEVMVKILDRALQVIEAADAGALFLYDAEEHILRPAASAGFDWEAIRHVRLQPAESMTGTTFQTRIPRIYEKAVDVQEGMVTMKGGNQEYYERSLIPIQRKHQGPLVLRSVMCAPLIVKDKCIGVLTIDNFSLDLSFTEDDLALLMTLANQAAIALENARLYESERQRSQLIQTQHEQLVRIHEAHQQLMQLVLKGKGFDELALTISTILQNPVLIYDALFRLAAEHGQHGIQADIPPFFPMLQKMVNLQQPMRISPSLQVPLPYPVTLIPIAASDRILGTLCVMESNRVLDEQDLDLAEQCGLVLALDLLKEEAVYETEQRLKGEFLNELKSERNLEILKERAKALGLSIQDAYMVMVVDFPQNDSRLHYLQRILEKDVLNRNPHSLVINRYQHTVILTAWRSTISVESIRERSRKLAHSLIEFMQRRHGRVACSIGIGRVCLSLDELVKSYEEASQCVSMIRSQGQNHVVRDYQDMGATRFLLDRPKEELLQFAMDLLQPLLQYPLPKRQEWLKTLDAFIIHGRSLKEAAASLHIQPNTFSYRLKRIEEVLGFSLDDYGGFFNLSFAWKVLETYGRKQDFIQESME